MKPVRWIPLLALALVLGVLVARLALVERAPSGTDGASARAEPAPAREQPGDAVELVDAETVPDAVRTPPAATVENAATPAAVPTLARRTPAELASRLRALLPEPYGKLTEADLLALEELDLHGAKLDASDLAALAALPALRTLSLRGTPVTDDSLAALRGLALESLDLRDTRVSGACFANLPAAGLRALHLTGTDVTETDLARLPAMPALETLKLNFLSLSDAAIDSLAIYPRLTHVELDQTTLSDAGLARLLALNPGIRRVEARNTRVTAEGVDALRSAYPDCEVVYGQPDLALQMRGR